MSYFWKKVHLHDEALVADFAILFNARELLLARKMKENLFCGLGLTA